ncbi:MAG: hypothetical protein D6808_03010, partial [Candidatus Dadabacteria bacterium]
MNGDLKIRVKTATLLVSLLAVIYLLSFFSFSRWLFAGLIFVVLVLCSWEYADMLSLIEHSKGKIPLYVSLFVAPSFLALLCMAYFGSTVTFDVVAEGQIISRGLSANFALTGVTLGLVLSGFIVLFLGIIRAEESLERMAELLPFGFLPLFHIGLCGSLLLILTCFNGYQWIILWLMLVVFSNDIAAYFAGLKMQGPKIAPVVSPSKTLSGSIGGAVAGVFSGLIFSFLLQKVGIDSLGVVSLSLLVVLAAQLGDLSKSFVKRS